MSSTPRRTDPLERRQQATGSAPAPAADSLVGALKGIGEGALELFSQRLTLARRELVDELKLLGGSAGVIAAGGAVALFGYVLLNAAIILLVGALWGGLLGMGVSALVLALLNLGAGLGALVRSARRLQEGPGRLEQTRSEWKKDQEWLQELRHKPALPSPPTEP